MQKDYMIIDGREVRVESNWNSMVAFLKETENDSLSALTSLNDLKPSDIAPLMAACVNEGERLEGRESHYTGKDIGALCSVQDMTEFVQIFARQSTLHVKAREEAKKKGQES